MSWRITSVEGTSVVAGVHDGRPWAIEDRCSHADCAFSTDGEIVDAVAVCNSHGSEFDVFTGEVLRPPAREPVRVFSVRLVDGRVEVSS